MLASCQGAMAPEADRTADQLVFCGVAATMVRAGMALGAVAPRGLNISVAPAMIASAKTPPTTAYNVRRVRGANSLVPTADLKMGRRDILVIGSSKPLGVARPT